MFRFAHPEYLYLLLAAPALVALFAWALYDAGGGWPASETRRR